MKIEVGTEQQVKVTTMLINLKNYKGKLMLPSLPITYLSIGSNGKPLGYMSIDYITIELMYNTETVVDNIKCENFGSLLYSRDLLRFIELVQGSVQGITKVKFEIDKNDGKTFKLARKVLEKYFGLELKYLISVDDNKVVAVFWKGV